MDLRSSELSSPFGSMFLHHQATSNTLSFQSNLLHDESESPEGGPSRKTNNSGRRKARTYKSLHISSTFQALKFVSYSR